MISLDVFATISANRLLFKPSVLFFIVSQEVCYRILSSYNQLTHLPSFVFVWHGLTG